MKTLKYDIGQYVNVVVTEPRLYPEPALKTGSISKIVVEGYTTTYEVKVTLWYTDQLDITRNVRQTLSFTEAELDAANPPKDSLPKSLD